MAKLSAHGSEVARFERVKRPTVEQDGRRSEVKETIAFMSDGVVLRKDSVILRGEESYPGSNKITGGWRLAARNKAEEFPSLKQRLLAQGYEEVSS